VCQITLFLFYKKRKPVLKEKTGKARGEEGQNSKREKKEKPRFFLFFYLTNASEAILKDDEALFKRQP